MNWAPHVTVAAIAPSDGRFLIVEERSGDRLVYNQPAGHLEPGESLIEAVIRETFEETGWDFEPRGLVGIYRWQAPNAETFIRFAMHGVSTVHHVDQRLDPEIVRTLWCTRDELNNRAERLRSPLVMRCIDDYLRGSHASLDLLRDLGHG